MRIDRRMRGIVAEIAIASVYFPALCLPQNPNPTFHAETELVTVDVQVVHVKTGTPAPLLTARDFEIYEEGVRQTILHCSRDEYPLSVVLLFDLTDSVRGVLTRLAAGARTAINHFKPADEVAVMVYAGHARLIDDFTTNRAQTLAAIQRAAAMKSPEPAYFNEAVYQAATQLGKVTNATNRRVIIWLTDNLWNIPAASGFHSEAEAMRALHEQSVVVAPILLRSAFWEILAPLARAAEAPLEKSYPPGDAHKYAELSGGQTVSLRGKQPDERLAQLIDEMHARYTIAYRPSDPQPAGTFRKIKVALNLPHPKEWKVLATSGYYRK